MEVRTAQIPHVRELKGTLMAIEIVSATAEPKIGNLVVVLYGPPGLGKTTLACTAQIGRAHV